METLDVKNAFNSTSWCDMHRTLDHFFRIPQYLLLMMEWYLSDRALIYDTTDGLRRKENLRGYVGLNFGPDL